ncbi:MAG TPA: LacI family DNA-binding transcriptional regulator [Acidimicrobiia bacterium]|nr:LacI family DNA-binding transcriptional regulator [Acidimicrobiia bacterium]
MAKPFARSTFKEVASIAGVSTQTVSRVTSERPDVSPLERIPHP